ncbi:MAG: DMT family transporter [Betaproteobacteria bacterium]|nr:DMT family transporter [Betaproteobacteria bacterium]
MEQAATVQQPKNLLAVGALLLGAVAIATSALFVKVSEAGPVATAFWRVFLALPLLWAWSMLEQRERHSTSFVSDKRLLIAAGLFFAGDLAVWHWSIMLTSIANSTLLANLAPIFVMLAAWLLFRHQLSAKFLAGLATALTGMVVLIGGDFTLSGKELIGDALGVVTAVFYAGYQLTVTRLRARVATSTIMAWSGLFTAIVLLPIALLSGERMLPVTDIGWLKLIGLALISQVAGQSLIAYAMAHLPATFSSVGLLFQPVMAAVFAWILLGEAVSALQLVGGITVLIGIRIVHRAETAR